MPIILEKVYVKRRLKTCGKWGKLHFSFNRERTGQGMIKGVNHRVVEVTGMENDYFEKAILYVRPDKCTVSQTRIDLEARSAVGKIVPRENEQPAQCSRFNAARLTAVLISIAVSLLSLALILYLFIG